MSTLNKVQLIGNVGKDPEIRTFQKSGNKFASFTVATSESWKDKNTGEKKTNTQWHRISVFNESIVEFVEKYLKKGNKVYIEGQIETRKYQDKDGVEKTSFEVVLKQYKGVLTILDSKKVEEEETHKGFDRQGNGPSESDMTDDFIPF